MHVALAVLEFNRAALADAGEQLAGRVRDGRVDLDPQRREERRDLGAQRVDAVAGQCRHEHRATDRPAGRRRVGSGAFDEVRLVERDEPWLVAGAELVEDGLDGLAVLGVVGIGRVDDLDEDIGRLTSSSVARNASTSWCGSLWMNPTVSVTIAVWPSPSLTWREVGSSVANSLSSARATSLPTSALSSVDLPAFV